MLFKIFFLTSFDECFKYEEMHPFKVCSLMRFACTWEAPTTVQTQNVPVTLHDSSYPFVFSSSGPRQLVIRFFHYRLAYVLREWSHIVCMQCVWLLSLRVRIVELHPCCWVCQRFVAVYALFVHSLVDRHCDLILSVRFWNQVPVIREKFLKSFLF